MSRFEVKLGRFVVLLEQGHDATEVLCLDRLRIELQGRVGLRLGILELADLDRPLGGH